MIPAACQPSSPTQTSKKRSPVVSSSSNQRPSESPVFGIPLDKCPCPKCGKDLTLLPKIKQLSEEEGILWREQVRAKEERLHQLQEEITRIKLKMQDLVEVKTALANTWGQILARRLNIRIARKACAKGEHRLKNEMESLRLLERNNSRRSDHLKHVRSKNLTKKEEALKAVIDKDREVVRRRMLRLEVCRKTFITDLNFKIFPIEVLPLSHEDEGAEDYQEQTKIDCDQLLEVDEGWMLGGVHRHPTPHISIVSPSLPSNGDHTPYLQALRERRRRKEDEAAVQVHPTSDPYQSTPGALVYISQFVEVLAWVLDQPLPFPIHRPEAISEHGFLVKRKRSFLNSMAQLDDNIMYLCFTQGVPLSALAVGHTLQNLLALVTHIHLGRSGPFDYHPELMSYRSSYRNLTQSKPSTDADDTQPPNVYATDKRGGSQGEESDSDEWEEEEASASALHGVPAIDSMEWEDLELSPAEAHMFEEERKAALRQQAGRSPVEVTGDEFERRAWRLDYDSTYADMKALASMSSVRRSQVATATSTGLVDSQHKAEAQGGEKGAEQKEGESSGVAASLFGTLSSLWSSTFGTK